MLNQYRRLLLAVGIFVLAGAGVMATAALLLLIAAIFYSPHPPSTSLPMAASIFMSVIGLGGSYLLKRLRDKIPKD
jgi:tellurite resistance protein TehA-like permease